jgi:uncharacterized membrane protein YbaN (DUF454 family)
VDDDIAIMMSGVRASALSLLRSTTAFIVKLFLCFLMLFMLHAPVLVCHPGYSATASRFNAKVGTRQDKIMIFSFALISFAK